MKKLNVIVSTLAVLLFLVPILSFGGDLDDGISKFTDDKVAKYDDLGKADTNISFIVLNATTKAKSKTSDKISEGKKKSGDANMNSVVLGVGSKVKGDIYIIDKSKGPKTNIAD